MPGVYEDVRTSLNATRLSSVSPPKILRRGALLELFEKSSISRRQFFELIVLQSRGLVLASYTVARSIVNFLQSVSV